jgi:hypothetical protein
LCTERYCPTRLGPNEYGVGQCMQNSRNRDQTEQIDGHKRCGIDQSVDEPDNEEWQDVLKVVAMGSESGNIFSRGIKS